MEFSKDFKVFRAELKEVLAQAEKEVLDTCGYVIPPLVLMGSTKTVNIELFKCLEISHCDFLMLQAGNKDVFDTVITQFKAQTSEFVEEIKSQNPSISALYLGLFSAPDPLGVNDELLREARNNSTMMIRQYYYGVKFVGLEHEPFTTEKEAELGYAAYVTHLASLTEQPE
jgi:hypothetical protein